MYPYGANSAYNQGYIGPSAPPHLQQKQQEQPQQVVHHHVHIGNTNSNDMDNGPPPPQYGGGRKRFSAKFSQAAQTVVPSVIACIFIQAVAAFFQNTADTTFRVVIREVDDFSDDQSHDQYVISIVFNVFFAFAAAMTAPMIRNSGYNTIILSGTVLFIFSTMSSSLVSTAKILVLPYGIFGACAYGLLRVGSEVAILDYLNNKRAIATALINLGMTVGQVVASMCFVFTDMIDDAQYDDDGKTRWQNNMRIIEVTAVIALMAGAVLKKPSHALGQWPEVFQYKPFYTLTISYFFVLIGFSLFGEIALTGPDELNLSEKAFDVHPIFTPFFIYLLAQFGGVLIFLILAASCCTDSCKKYACLIGGLAAIALAGGSFAHEEAYSELWQFAAYTGGVGLMTAFIRVSIPLAMIYYTGRDNYKIALPFLEFAGALGGLVAFLIQAEKPSDMTFSDTWYLCGALFGAFALGSLLTFCLFPSWSKHKAGGDEMRFRVLEAVENEAFEPEDENYE